MWGIIALLIFAAIIILLQLANVLVPIALLFGAVVFLVIFFKFFVKKFEPYESALIYRFGRFHRASPSGWTILIPGMERIGAVVDLREQRQDIEIPIISQEGLEINLGTIAYFYVTNAVKSVLHIQNYKEALVELIRSRVRDLAGEFTFTQLVINIEDISDALRKQVASVTENWGLEITTFEIAKLDPPEEIMDALRGKRVAQEELEAKRFMAEARRIITAALGEGTKTFDDKTTTYLYIKALENMKSSKMMIPTEFMDIVKPGGSQGNLAKGMIAGTTFNKALNMIGQEIMQEESIGKREIEEIVDNNNNNNEKDDEEKFVAGDSADGTIDGSVDSDNNTNESEDYYKNN
ncbi:MAG: SPFH domain-containing protein [Nanoarchaeota archaeon]|nr:SPFH domain-containing protein [Nanoarchaeota archaeon]MBU4351520.1 SPFH domain-containing protein [Nanoarchaeota archaeon]